MERAARLQASELELEDGVAEITFDCGARIVLEGPALLTIEASTRASLAIGRIVAHVPPAARGFTVVAPSVTVVDLGTEFGLDVDAAGTAEVQVFEGQVELRPTAAQAGTRPLLLNVAGLARFDLQIGEIKAPLIHAANFIRRVEERVSRPPLTLVEEGGRFAPNNLATLPGAWAFGKNVLLGFPYHRVEYLSDGRYGNDHSWIGAEGESSFGGVVLGGPCRIDSIAFGRDNRVASGQDTKAGKNARGQSAVAAETQFSRPLGRLLHHPVQWRRAHQSAAPRGELAYHRHGEIRSGHAGNCFRSHPSVPAASLPIRAGAGHGSAHRHVAGRHVHRRVGSLWSPSECCEEIAAPSDKQSVPPVRGGDLPLIPTRRSARHPPAPDSEPSSSPRRSFPRRSSPLRAARRPATGRGPL